MQSMGGGQQSQWILNNSEDSKEQFGLLFEQDLTKNRNQVKDSKQQFGLRFEQDLSTTSLKQQKEQN